MATGEAVLAVDVLTNNYDQYRTGANRNEATLNTTNVTPATFGRLYHYTVDAPVFAQPLVATDVSVPDKGARAVVYLATANNSVYAFDATQGDDAPLWHAALTALPDGRAARVSGILSTPVIDRAGGRIYVVAGLMDGARAKFVLHALDLADGGARSGAPVIIAGAVSVDVHRIAFEPSDTRIAVQRAALTLARDKVIVAFGGDYFEGWVFAFDKSDLRAPPAAFCTTCASRVASISGVDYRDRKCVLLGPGGGIWQSGRGPVVDASGTVYFFTGNKQHVIKDGCPIAPSDNACARCFQSGGCVCAGNRSSQACRGPDACVANAAREGEVFDTNEALIALDPGAGLKLTGWFRPENWDAPGVHGLEVNDLDLGGSGPLLIPGTSRLIGGGKQGVMYVLDSSLPTPCTPSLRQTCLAANPLQSFQIAPIPPRPKEFYRHLLGGPVLWTRAAAQGGSLAYVWRQNDHLRSYRVADRFEDCDSSDPPPTTTHNCASAARSKEFIDHHPGGILSLSANDADVASAIVWAVTTRLPGGAGKLMAFKAVPDPAAPNELRKLWDSDDCEGDGIVIGADFVPPTVVNGRVYVATGANRVEVYGLINNRVCTPPARPDPMWQMLQ